MNATKGRPKRRPFFLSGPRGGGAVSWSRSCRFSGVSRGELSRDASADVLAPSRFHAHIGLTCDGSADTYRALLAGGELRPSERPVRVPCKPLKAGCFFGSSDSARRLDVGSSNAASDFEKSDRTAHDRGHCIVVLCEVQAPFRAGKRKALFRLRERFSRRQGAQAPRRESSGERCRRLTSSFASRG
jgi:hypothetical protein